MRQLAESVKRLQGDFEVIVADGGSLDETPALAREAGFRVVDSVRGRGQQMNAGAREASGEILVFLHADTCIPENALAEIERSLSDPKVCGGNFSLIFDGTSWESRALTVIYPFLRLGGMCYGDSAIFVRRSVFEELKGYKDYPLFEDCELYQRMRRVGRFVRLPQNATTSSRRFQGRFLRTFALWSLLQSLYWIGVHPVRLNRLYKQAR